MIRYSHHQWRGAWPDTLLMAVCALMILLTAFPAAAQNAYLPPDARFGVVNAWADPEAAVELGIGWELVTFEWAALQPAPGGDLALEAVDLDYLDSAREAGREVVGLIVGTPAWASGSGSVLAVPEGLALPHDDAGNHWGQFVAALVAEFAPRGIQRWVIYDALDVPVGEGKAGFAGSVTDYARMLRVARLAALSVDADTRLLIGALEWWPDVAAGREPYLARLLAELQRDPDAGAYEYYAEAVLLRVTDTTAGLWTVLDSAQAILAGAGMPDIALWLLTNAAPTLDTQTHIESHILGTTLILPGVPLPRVYAITPDQQADFMIQAVSIALAAGVERIAVTQLVDDLPAAWGLIRADGSRRPAFEAYRSVRALFSFIDGGRALRVVGGDVLHFVGGGQEIVVVWAAEETAVTLTVTAPEVGEPGLVYGPQQGEYDVTAQAIEWPAAHVVAAPGALRDANGFLTVAGSPRVLAFPREDEFYRVMYLDVGPRRTRLQ